MGFAQIVKESLGKLLTAPSLILWIFFSLLILAVPASVAMGDLISDSLGPSLERQDLLAGFDLGWWEEFLHVNGGGLANTFGPDVTGGLLVLTNLETFLDGRVLASRAPVLLTGLLFLLVWAFFQGGIIDRYAFSEEAHSRERLFARSGHNFYRMFRLALFGLLGYLLIFGFLGNRLNTWKNGFFEDSTTEGPVLLASLAIYFLLFLLWWIFGLGLDYSKVALVVERRRSALFSCFRGFGFVLSHLGKCIGLGLLALLLTVIVGGIYYYLAPGYGQATWQTVGLAFLAGQLFVVARLSTRLFAIATQATFFTGADLPTATPRYLESEPRVKPAEVPAPPPESVTEEAVPAEDEPAPPEPVREDGEGDEEEDTRL